MMRLSSRSLNRTLSVGLLFFFCLGTPLVQDAPAERAKASTCWAGKVRYTNPNRDPEVLLSIGDEKSSDEFKCIINHDPCTLSYPSGGGDDEFNIEPDSLDAYLVGHIDPSDGKIAGTWREPREGEGAEEYGYELSPITGCTPNY
jgi:hypothetical protein